MKFAGDGGRSKPLVILGELKSSISSLNIMPVDLERIIAPNLLIRDIHLYMKEEENIACYSFKNNNICVSLMLILVFYF